MLQAALIMARIMREAGPPACIAGRDNLPQGGLR